MDAVSEFRYYPFRGYGFQPSRGFKYGPSYWESFRARDKTPIGKVLTADRARLANEFTSAGIVDIGIGGGAFVEAMDCLGADVNADAIAWLKRREALWNYEDEAFMMTFWDSLEHIQTPEPLLKKCTGFAIVSTPIYRDGDHMVNSKHYKPDEHIHYWTDRGLKLFMSKNGFSFLRESGIERNAGREDIGCYVFERVDGCYP